MNKLPITKRDIRSSAISIAIGRFLGLSYKEAGFVSLLSYLLPDPPKKSKKK
tara:strand:- start:15 stop:170 length:156 start_codon:yes stop_codon:yes gene_type:complete